MQFDTETNDKRGRANADSAGSLESLSGASPHAALGAVIELMSYSKYHQNYTVMDIMRVIAPPIALGQCYLFRQKGVLFGFISWADLSEEAEIGYINGTRKLQVGDWNAGNRFWMIDVLFPRGGRAAAQEKFLDLTADKIGKMLRIKEDGTRKVYDWYGKNHRASRNVWWRAK